MFKAAANNSTLNRVLREDKNVFFLHLLGLDTTGHAYRPYSKEYLHNIKVVDQGVEYITRLIEDFYGDNETAFVFTADHGMSDWGSHGDGHPDNTRTPLIAWGSGVKMPVIDAKGKAKGHEDGFSADWGLDQIERHDVAQADIAALMAYLVGLEFPVNSVGQLPLPYVAGGRGEQAEAAFVNAQGILEMYRVKEEQKRATELRYKPFAAFGTRGGSVQERLFRIRQLLDEGSYDTSIEESHELSQLGLSGLRYLQTYDWLFLRALVTMGYLGWIAFALTTVIDLHVLDGKTATSRTGFSNATFGATMTALYSLLVIRRSPWTYYTYAFFPVFFWEEVFARRRALYAGRITLLDHIRSRHDVFILLLKTLASMGLLEALVSSEMSICWFPELLTANKVLSYFHREVYTICFIAAALWPAVYGREFYMHNKLLIATWAVACFSMSIFTLLPVIKVENISVMSVPFLRVM